MGNKTFFEKNDADVSFLICKVLMGMTLIFPALFILSATHIFSVSISYLLRVVPVGLICTLSPMILYKLRVSIIFIKNYSILAVAFFIVLMAANHHIGIYITYALPLALSCMYFDKKFTIRTALIGYIGLIIALYLRSGNVPLYDEPRMSWFTGYAMGYTMEYAAMSAVFISLAARARRILENLHNTERVKQILSDCGEASIQLSDVMENLKAAIDNTVKNNKVIEQEADKTMTGCEDTLQQVHVTNNSIETMKDTMQETLEHTKSMSELASNSYQKTQNYIKTMQLAVESIQQIGYSSESIQKKVLQLGSSAQEIAAFTDTIEKIAGQTNMLALNASIEAARAGEHGRGFSVVASQIGELAAESRKATKNIVQQITHMNQNVEETHIAVIQNGELVTAGISEIEDAKKEAGNLVRLQEESSQRVDNVQQNIIVNVEHQQKVSEMADGMNDIISQSQKQIESIQQAIQQQIVLAQHVEAAFKEVLVISDRLLQISRQE